MRILVIRSLYGTTFTAGTMLLNHQPFGYTLEDALQSGPKRPGLTAIPAGRYKLALTMSNRFQKMLPQLMEVPGFAGVRIHGGNTPADTEGCILVARNRLAPDRIQDSLSAPLVQALADAGGEHEIQIVQAWKD